MLKKYWPCQLLLIIITGVNVASHWKDIHKISKSHLDEHTFAFNDVHLLLSCVGAGDKKATQHMLESLEQFIRSVGTTVVIFLYPPLLRHPLPMP